MGWIFLSHVLGPETPGYGGNPGFWSERKSAIADGCSSNSSEWRLSNHIGTHVDAPFHFADAGAKVDEFSAGSWVFERPVLVDLAAEPGELILPRSPGASGAWAEKLPEDADLLLLRTGFERHRGQTDYWERNPGLSPELGRWLRTERPGIRAIGVDFISTTSWQHRPVGRVAHRAFLDPAEPVKGAPVLIIEDMALGAIEDMSLGAIEGVAPGSAGSRLRRVIVAPVRVGGADGAPVTVFAELA